MSLSLCDTTLYRSKLFSLLLVAVFCLLIFQLLSTKKFETSIDILEKKIEAPPRPKIQQLKDFVNAVDSIDGIGYKFDDSIKPLDPRYEVLNNLPACDLSKDRFPAENDASEIMREFKKCIVPLVEKWRGKPSQLNLDWVKGTVECDKLEVYKKLKVDEFPNLHEIKWAILPKCKEENNMVTFGVGHDTVAEEFLNRTLPNTKFYGVDPIIEPNLQLYSRFGRFFPFAIGQKAGIQRFKILPNQNQRTRQYTWQDVTTVDIIYFLKNILNLKKVDFMWIDIESGEFEFIKMMNKGGELDQNGITICQFNMEVHSGLNEAGEQVFHDFIFKMLEHDRYVFLKPMSTGKKVHRMLFINVESPECVRKFIQ